MKRNRLGRPPHPDILTPAEWRVLEALREGGTNAEIGARLGLAPDTVKYRVSNMLAKLGLRNRRELAAWQPDAGRRGLGGLLPVPASLESLARSVVTVGVGAAAVAGVVVAAIAVAGVVLVLLVAGDGNGDLAVVRPPAAGTPPPSPTPAAPAATDTPTPTVTPASTPTVTPSPTLAPTATPAPAPTPTASPTPEPTLPPVATPPPGRYVDVKAGHRRACALTEEGEVVCWGDLDEGHPEVLPGTYEAVVSPEWYEYDQTRGTRDFGACALDQSGEVQCWEHGFGMRRVSPPGHYTLVSASTNHMCALTADETAVCWGNNRDGQAEAPPGRFNAISAGYAAYEGDSGTSCGLTDIGRIVCWGTSFAVEDLPPGPYVKVSTRGAASGCAIGNAGNLVCWSRDSLGDPPSGRFQDVDAGLFHTCAVTAAGEARCWGGLITLLTPPDPPPGRYKKISIGSETPRSIGTEYACALTEAGQVVCWEAHAPVTTQPDPSPGRYTAVSDGGFQTCALTEDGEATCWGWSMNGQTDPPAGPFTAISAGDAFVCALKDTREIVCWGDDGLSDDIPPGTYAEVSAGYTHACALTEDGEVACWGWSRFGDLDFPPGDYTTVSAGLSNSCALGTEGRPVCLRGGPPGEGWADGRYVDIAVGGRLCALREDGAIVCEDSADASGGVSIRRGPFMAITAGWGHTCALTTAGEAQCWGYNSHGQADPPTQRFEAISASEVRTCGLTADGDAVCWGDVAYSKLPFRY